MSIVKKISVLLLTLCAVFALAASPAAAAESSQIDPNLILSPQTSLTVSVDGKIVVGLSGKYSYGETASVSAPSVAEKTFSYWTNGSGEIISYAQSLSMNMYANTIVNAVYGDSETTPANLAAFTSITRYGDSICFCGTGYAASGEVTDSGILYSTTAKTLSELQALSKDEAIETSGNGWTLQVTPEDEDTTYYAVAYAVAGGETCYSAVKSVKFSELESGVSMVANLGDVTLPKSSASFCRVDFDPNGGEGSMLPQGMVKGVTTTLSTNAYTSVQVFAGWNTKADGTGTPYADRASVTFTSNITLYAQWKQKVITRSVTVAPGSHMTKTTDSGDESQTELSGAMTDVVYTADDGYYFPTDYSVGSVNGISVTRNSYTQITVSGTPTADASITLTAPTAKTKPDVPTTVAALNCTTAANNDGKLTGVTAAMEYKESNAASWTSGTGEDITGLVPGTYYVRTKATNTTLASDNQELTIKAVITADVTFKVVNGSWDDGTKAKKTITLTGLEGDALKLTANQIPAVGGKPDDAFKAGSWNVTPSTDTEITKAITYTYTYASKDAVDVTKAPTAKALTYTASKQNLVTAGNAEGGTMQYALGENETTAPTSGYTASIPTAIDAGTYHVWYRVAGDKDHSDSVAACVDVTIAPRKLTVAADAKSSAYGAKPVKLTFSVTSGSLAGDDKLSSLGVKASTEATSASNVGTYPIKLSGGKANSNYAVKLKGATYTVTAAELSVTSKGFSGTYDGKAHGITVKASAKGAKVWYGTKKLTAKNYRTAGSTKTVSRKDVGTTKVYFYVVAPNYEPASGSATVTVEPIAVPSTTATAYVQGKGAVKATGGAYVGTVGQSLRLEALSIKLPDTGVPGGIEYRSHLQGKGWESSWSRDGQVSGAKGEGLRLEAIQVRLYGQMAKVYDVYYRVHVQGFGWMAWAKNGQKAGTEGMSRRGEAVQVVLVRKGATAPAKTYKGEVQSYAKAFVKK